MESLAVALAALLIAGPVTAAEKLPPLTLSGQGSFFVGGKDIRSPATTSRATGPTDGTIMTAQVYVHYQIPAKAGKRKAITFIHGCCLTGKTWETTPDGRMGWDEYMLRQNYPVYVIDQAWRGRSAIDPTSLNSVKLGREKAESLPTVNAASHEGAWTLFRFGTKYPEPNPGLQFPLEAQAELWKQMVPDWSGTLGPANPTVPALAELADKIDGTVLISHSQSGIFPFQAAALSRKGIAGIVAIEPAACPAATDAMTPYANLPILVMFGDFLAGTSWGETLKKCQAFAQAANAAGGKVEVVALPDVGFHGNSHMLMQDKNSLDVAKWLAKWIDTRVR